MSPLLAQLSVDLSASAILAGVATLAISLGGALLRRSISAIDTKLTSVDSKLDVLASGQQELQVRISTLEVRVSKLELDLRDLARRVDDHSGWLSKKGFSPRGDGGSW